MGTQDDRREVRWDGGKKKPIKVKAKMGIELWEQTGLGWAPGMPRVRLPMVGCALDSDPRLPATSSEPCRCTSPRRGAGWTRDVVMMMVVEVEPLRGAGISGSGDRRPGRGGDG